MLPGIVGLDVCKQLKSDPKTQHIPIVMLTAKSEEMDQVVGFTVGADDYVTKPFSVKVLLQRIRALHRRADTVQTNHDVIEHLGDVVLAALADRVGVEVLDQLRQLAEAA
jgi:two-component system phosphate regulon response regulator PhoB